MPRLTERDNTYFQTVRSMCGTCREIVPARVFFRSDHVYQQSLCPACANAPALIADDKNWYLANILKAFPDQSPLPAAKPSKLGCPHDCGPCTWHAASPKRILIPITNAVDPGPSATPFHMPLDRVRRIIESLADYLPHLDEICITGAEPELHPQLIDILRACKRPDIPRITMTTDGIILAGNHRLCEKLADLDISVTLSFNEAKTTALENLARAGVTIALDITQNDVAQAFNLMRKYDNVRSLTAQCSPASENVLSPTQRIAIDKAAMIVSEQSDAILGLDNFTPDPQAHPLCYLVCRIVKKGKKFVPATDSERNRTGESPVRTIRIHNCMDAETFDCSRAMLCPDQICAEPGRLIGKCTYNLFHRTQHDSVLQRAPYCTAEQNK